jgi:transposase
MTQFPTAAHLASWAGVCPGNNESAGKRVASKVRKGSPLLRRTACQCAWAAARTKNTYLSAQFKRLAARRGRKCAIIAVATVSWSSATTFKAGAAHMRTWGATISIDCTLKA